MTNRDLSGKVAVVTGGSRGLGKGIALELGAAGATVIITGRSLDTSVHPAGGTISQTAQEVTAIGGTGIAMRCDHTDDEQVRAVFDQVRADHGRLDILVNNASNAQKFAEWMVQPIWEQGPQAWADVVDGGVRMHYVATVYGSALMIENRQGLVVNISSIGAANYLHSVVYGMGKAATDKLSADSAVEFAPHNVVAVSLWPGGVATESVEMLAETMDIDLTPVRSSLETARFTGRAVVALATDPNAMARTGQAWIVAELAREYGFTDVDGNLPPVLRTVEEMDKLMGLEPAPPVS
jgi:NAD(P)-dependent dehydrogenase (short-subunit alcohol dehydrogenase family)